MGEKSKNTNSTIDKYDLPVKGFKNSDGTQATLNDVINHFEKKPLLNYLNRVEKTSKEIIENKKDPRIKEAKKILPLINTARNRIDKNEDSGFYIGSIAKLCEKANMIMLKDKLDMGLKYSKQQSELGKEGAKKRWGDKAEKISDIFAKLKDAEYEDYHADELWPVFIGMLDDELLNPIEDCTNPQEPKVKYDGGNMKYNTFKSRLSKKQPPK